MTPNARDTFNVPDDTKTEQDEHADGGGGGGGDNVGLEEEPGQEQAQEQARFGRNRGKTCPPSPCRPLVSRKTPVPVQI